MQFVFVVNLCNIAHNKSNKYALTLLDATFLIIDIDRSRGHNVWTELEMLERSVKWNGNS